MRIQDIFVRYRPPIERALEEFLSKKKIELDHVNRWGKDLVERLESFSARGKLIRGCLIALTHRMFSGKTPPWLFSIAAAYELIHSALLIHDDIMDRDQERRGEKTIFSQYRELGRVRKSSDADHLGLSLGICAGDCAFFLAFELLADRRVKPAMLKTISELWAKEFTSVGLAQMEDVSFSLSPEEPDESEILSMYCYKTARYTFSLPLMTGAVTAGCPRGTIRALEQLGEHMGIIFQLKDDELGLFSEIKAIGKPVGSDIREKKKTLYSLYLAQNAKNEFRKITASVMREKAASSSHMTALKRLAETTGVHSRIQNLMGERHAKAQHLIASLHVDERKKALLRELLEYNLTRSR